MKTPRLDQSHHAVIALQVTGGFLDALRLEFVDGLNCLIGGRGAGKTTALEFLRFGLGLMPDPKLNADRHRVLDALVKANLRNGRLSIDVRTKNGTQYTAARSLASDVEVLNEKGAPAPISLDSSLFSADVFSQNEIEEIAASPAEQLALLDRFVEEQMTEVRAELAEHLHGLDSTAQTLLKLDQELEALRATASELKLIEEKLKAASTGSGPEGTKVAAAHAAANSRVQEKQVPEQVAAVIQQAVNDVSGALVTFRASAETHVSGINRTSENRDPLEAMETALVAFERALSRAESDVRAAGVEAEVAIAAQRNELTSRHAAQQAEYGTLVALLAEEGGRAAERQKLQQSLAVAAAAEKEQQSKEKLRNGVVERRDQHLARTSELRDKRFELRRQVAEDLNKRFSTIRVKVAQTAELNGYRDLVAEGLAGSGVKNLLTAKRLTEVFLPDELSRAVLDRDCALVSSRTGFDDDKARKIIDALRSDDLAYRLETVDLDDVPTIELLDGGEFKASPNLSTGQRCTTILPLLLVQSARPLLIDQPEDNLDNAFIYDTVVKALQEV